MRSAFFHSSDVLPMDQREHVIACARRFMDVRFRHQGRSVAGVDCLGLLLLTAEEAGVTFGGTEAKTLGVPRYGVRPDTTLLKQKLDEFLDPVITHEIRPADIVLLRVHGSPQHLAIITDYPMRGELGMIHAYAPAGKVVEHRYDPVWRKETYAAYRLPHIH
jgi:hypothetical protein